MKILIYGSGAVGLGLASCLLRSGEKVDIIARENTKKHLAENGLLRTGIFGKHHSQPELFTCFLSLDEISNIQYDYVLVCTKSYDSEAVAKDLSLNSSILHDRSKIILFQNGWGNAENFIPYFPKEHIYNARVITGFFRPSIHHVDITVHVKPINIGCLFSSDLSCIENICKSIAMGGIPCEATQCIDKDLWAKMLFNCALNALSAVFNVTYGELAEKECCREIMNEVINEIFCIMDAADYETHWNNAESYIDDFYKIIVPLAAKHKSSTLQDIQAHKKTEIETLNGAVVLLGKKLDVSIPCNIMLCNMIKFLESKY